MVLFTFFGLFILVSTVLGNVLLSLFVYENNPRSATNRIFGLLGIALSFWLIDMFLAQNPDPAFLDLFLSRLSFFLATPMDILFLMLALTVPRTQLTVRRRWLWLLIATGVVVMVLAMSTYTFRSLQFNGITPSPVPGPALPVVGGFNVLLVLGSAYVLWRRMQRTTGKEKEQLRFVMYGILFMFGLVILTIFLPILFFQNALFVRAAPLYALLFLGMTAYAIVKHRLLDVRLILARAVSFLLLLFFLGAAVTFTLVFVLQGVIGQRIDRTTLIAILISSLAGFLLFQPIKTLARKLTDRIFFEGEYDADALLGRLTRIMVEQIDLDRLIMAMLKTLLEQMHVSKGAFLLIKDHAVTAVRGIGYDEATVAPASLELLFHQAPPGESGSFVFDELENGATKEELRTLDIAVAIPITVEKNEVAMLLLGPKLSGETYYQRDVDFLRIFAGEAGIAIQNAVNVKSILELDAAKSEFIAVVSHQLRTPLSVARWNLELLLENAKAGRTQPRVRTMLNDAYGGLMDLNHGLDDLLVALEIAEHKVRLHVDTFDIIQDVVTPAAERLKEQLAAKKIRLTIRPVGTSTTVQGDRDKLRRVVMTLIANAIDYSPERTAIKVLATEESGKLRVSVEDQGIGVPTEIRERIVEKFFRGEEAKKVAPDGLGVGLYIVDSFIKLHGGRLIIEDGAGGKGARFTFEIPLRHAGVPLVTAGPVAKTRRVV